MRLRLMASYRGVTFQAGLGPDGTQATLISSEPPPADLGFGASAGHWRKQVRVADLQSLWFSRPVGAYRGEPCLVLDDLGDRLHIAYLGRDAVRAAQLGYWEIDREVFEVVVTRAEVAGLAEDRVDVPLAAAMFATAEAPAPDAATALDVTDAADEIAAAAATGEAAPPVTGETASTGAEAAAESSADEEPAAAGADEPAGPGLGRSEEMTAWHGSPGPWPELAAAEPEAPEPGASAAAAAAGPEVSAAGPEAGSGAGGPAGRRTARRDRVSPEAVLAELLSLAAIPHAAYAVEAEVPGAVCLVTVSGGFEVFSRTEDARLEVRFFEDEEAAYFYLFGVLAAEAVRSGRLIPNSPAQRNGRPHGSGPADRSGTPPAAPENVSKYLQGGKSPIPTPRRARVCLAGGADGPPLPKQPRRPS